MGCGGLAKLSVENQSLLQELRQIEQEKGLVAADREALTHEVQQLRSHVQQIVGENETLKQRVNIVFSERHPEMFEARDEDEMIESWREMDLMSGNDLLAALARIYPPCHPEVQTMLNISRTISNADSALPEYCAYFSARFDLFNRVWERIARLHFAMDDSFMRIKEGIAVSVTGVETMLGKKSDALESLKDEVRNLFKLEYAEFMDEQRRLDTKITKIKVDFYAKKLEEKENEKQQLMLRLDGEMKAIRARTNVVLEEKNRELAGIRGEMQIVIDDLVEKHKREIREISAKTDLLKDTHSVKTEKLKSALRGRIGEIRDEICQMMTSFTAFQRETERKITEFCDRHTENANLQRETYEKTIQKLNEKHNREKAAMKSLMKSNNSTIRSEILALEKEFKGFQDEISGKLVSFCDSYTKKANQNQLESDSRAYLQLEDFRSEILKRDAQAAALHSRDIKQRLAMRKEMQKCNAEIRRYFESFASDFALLQKKSSSEIVSKVRSEHEEYIRDLRFEAVSRAEMSKEDVRFEVWKRDEGLKRHQEGHERLIEDLKRQFEAEFCVMKEDARMHTAVIEEKADKRMREMACNLHSFLSSHVLRVKQSISEAVAMWKSELAPLSQFAVSIPAIDIEEIADISDISAKTGVEMYAKAAENWESALANIAKAVDSSWILTTSIMRNLVTSWLALESTRSQLHTKLLIDTSDFTQQISNLQAELRDVEQNHGSFSMHMSQKVSELEQAITMKSDNIREKEELVDKLNGRNVEKDREICVKNVTIEAMQQEIRLKDEAVSGLKTDLEKLSEESRTAISESETHIEGLKETIRITEEKLVQQNRINVQRRLFNDLLKKVKMLKKTYVTKWRIAVNPGFQPPVEVDEDEEVINSEFEIIESVLSEEKQAILSSNALLEAVQKSGSKPEKPLTIPQALKFFEEMMDRKYEADLSDMKNQRPLRTLPEFLIEYVNRTFGLKKLAVKMLCQLVPTLEIMSNEGIPYVLMLCRLVQISHPDPIPFPLSVFITKMRMEFAPLAEKYQREKEARDSKRGVKREVGKGKDKSPAPTGGEAYLLDVIGYIYSLFESDRFSGELMLKLLQPENITIADYIIFKICHKMAKLGLNAEGIFNMLDRDGEGAITEQDFVKGARRNLELWISAEDLSVVFSTMTGGEAYLRKEMFVSKVIFKTYLENCRSDQYIISRCSFLLSLIEVYHQKQLRDGTLILRKFGLQKAILFDSFEQIAKQFEPNIDQQKLRALFKQGLKISKDPAQGIDMSAYVRLLLRYPFGAFKNSFFCK